VGESGGNGQCFVISPIGDEGSDERQHADNVLQYIIQPAMQACHLVAVRSDHIAMPGLISTEVYKRILRDDICVVVLTGMNPNVLYELAIAHAAARPVVLLIQKGEEPPFDLKDHRYVEYDVGNVKALTGGGYAASVEEHVTYLLESDDPPTVPFDPALSPLGAASGGVRLAGRRELAALRTFFGTDALGDQGITVTVPVYHPLAQDNFDPTVQVTLARKTDEDGHEVERPIYGDVLHFDDYNSAQQIFTLLREFGAKSVQLQRDSEFLGHWDERPCVVCLGSPFVNAALGELARLSEDTGSVWVSGTRSSPTLDTYRVVVRTPQFLALGVDRTHALGVIVRLPNPSSPANSVVGIWGCRAESTYSTARYLHRSFRDIIGSTGTAPTVVLLACRGQNLDVVDTMYIAADGVVIERKDDLLRLYLREDPAEGAPVPPGGTS
jgi:hypothetical protein